MAEPRYAGYIFDLDGTIYLGDALIPGAQAAIERLRRARRPVVFLSNKPLEPRDNYARKLTRLGIPTPPEDVINSTQALIHLLRERHPGARLFVIAEQKLWDELARAGFRLTQQVDQVDVVVAAFDRTLDYTKLNLAHQALVRGAAFYATNGDKTCPVAGGEIPDCAGVIAFLEATTGRTLQEIAGKPSAHILGAALARLGVEAGRCLMVGDRLATDIAMGLAAGMDTALVLSGVTTREALAASGVAPTYVLESVADCP
jgi:NagD protein